MKSMTYGDISKNNIISKMERVTPQQRRGHYRRMRSETDLIDNPEKLCTGLQLRFAQAFAMYRSLPRAYRASYGGEGLPDRVMHKRARDVMGIPHVRAVVHDLIDQAAENTIFTATEALARFLAIAAADPNELVSVRVGACRYCHGVDFGYQWRPSEYLAEVEHAEKHGRAYPEPKGGIDYNATREPHPDCPECDGEGVSSVIVHDTETLSPAGQLLYGGAKVNKAGQVEVIVADRHKALETAAKIIGALKPDGVSLTVNNVHKMATVVNLATIDPDQARQAYMDMISLDGGVKPTYVFQPSDGETDT